MGLIDANALEKDGWKMHRIVQVDNNTMEYQTKKPTDFLTIEPDSCEDVISRKAAIKTILSQPTEAHYPEWYASQIKELPPAQFEIIRCKDCICAHSEVWLTGGGKSKAYAYGYCGKTNLKILPYDFCSKAERRTDA